MARLDLTNEIYGLLRCIKPAETRNGKTYWLCECIKCGAQKEIQTTHIRSGAIKSCGCGCIEKTIEKICPICGQSFKILSNKDNARKYCYECSPSNREHDYTPVYHAMKRELIKRLGGKCSKCGYDKCEAALQFHHRNPAEKQFTLSIKSGSHSWDEWQIEAEKCDLLCANCHAEIHYMQYENENC